MNDVFGEFMIATLILAQTLNHTIRNVTTTNQTFLQNCSYPLSILDVTFTTGKLFDEIRIDKFQTKVNRQNIPNWNPIDTCTLKSNFTNMMRNKQIT